MGDRNSDSSNRRDNDNTHKEIMLAGAMAAFTVELLVYPLDTIKTRMQSRDYLKTYATAKQGAATGLRRAAVPSAYALRGLYQGVGSVIMATLPASGVFFTTYEWAKRIVGHALPTATGKAAPPALVHAISSGMAELGSCLILTPAEVIKQNAQMIQKRRDAQGPSSRSNTSTSLQAFKMLAHAERSAARRLLAGYTALAARNLPFTAMQFPMFEALRVRLRKQWDAGDRSTDARHLAVVGAVNGLSAGLSGSIAAVITTPFDVVKTRMMLGADVDGDAKHKGRQHSAVHLARLIYREHGVRGLFRGGAFRAGWTFIGSGLYLGTYEVAKTWLRGGREEGDDASS